MLIMKMIFKNILQNIKSFEVEYKNAYNENNFQEYFAKYKDITRFYIDYCNKYWIKTLDPNKLMFLINPGN